MMKPLAQSQVGRPRIIFEDNIKTDISDMDFDQGKWMVLAEDPVAAFEPSYYYYGGDNWR
jgi:hypothetical protein